VVTLRTVGWKGKEAAEICSERVLEMVAKFLPINSNIETGVLQVEVKVEDVWGGRKNCFESCPIGSRVVGQVIGGWNIFDLNVAMVIHPQIMITQNVAKGIRIFILEGERYIIREYIGRDQEVVCYRYRSIR
jgi:hypothetical protein